MVVISDLLKEYSELPEFVGTDLYQVNQAGNFGNTPLHVASVRGDVEAAICLISSGANVNVQGELANTPLHEAVSSDNPQLLELLLKHGADRNAKNEFGQTPLDLARLTNRASMVTILCQQVE